MTCRGRAGSALGAVVAGLLASTSAQAQTVITADTAPGRATGTEVTTSGSVTTIDGGTRAGGNLFHSFGEFSLAGGDTALWTYTHGDPAAIAHVINRVTGGEVSQIDGTLDSTALPNADFWFINPAGIVIGAGAQVNVPAGAHFGTASALVLGDGAVFSARTPHGSQLTMAAPAAFGFLGTEGTLAVFGKPSSQPLATPGAFELAATSLAIRNRVITASDIALTATGGLRGTFASGGGAERAAKGDGTIAIVRGDLSTLDGGRIAVVGGGALISDSFLTASSFSNATSGSIMVAAGDLLVRRSAIISDSHGTRDGGGIVLAAKRDFALFDSSVFADSYGKGAAGSVALGAGRALYVDNDFVTSESFGNGAAGAVALVARRIDLTGSRLSSESGGSGSAGAIALTGSAIRVADTVLLSNATGIGEAGGIIVSAKRGVVLRGVEATSDTINFDGGFVGVTGAAVRIADSLLQSTTLGRGDGGGVSIAATERMIVRNSTLASDSLGRGEAGLVVLDAPDLQVGASFLSSEGYNRGDAGLVGLYGTRIRIDESTFTSRAYGNGAAGIIDVEGATVALATSDLSSTADGRGDAGGIVLGGTEWVALSQVDLESENVDGAGGLVAIAAPDIEIFGGEIRTSTYGRGAGGWIAMSADTRLHIAGATIFSDTHRFGDAGAIALEAPDLSVVGSYLTSETFGRGAAGIVSFTGADVLVKYDTISSSSQGRGNAGAIAIEGDRVRVVASILQTDLLHGLPTTEGGDVLIEADDLAVVFSDLSANTSGRGSGGRVTLTADTMTLDRASRISATTSGAGDAGAVTIEAADLLLDRGSEVSAATAGRGNAGLVSVAADSVILAGQSRITSSTAAEGRAGVVTLSAQALTLDRGSSVNTTTAGSGDAGRVAIEADTLSMRGAIIASDAAEGSSGDAGKVDVAAGTITLRSNAFIRSDTFGSGDAGRIAILAERLDARGSYVNSESFGLGRAGDIRVDAASLVLDSSTISSAAFGNGDAGRVRVRSEGLTSRYGYISTDANGSGNAGDVTIRVRGDIGFDMAFASSSASEGNAGSVEVFARDLAIIRQGGLISAAFGTGHAGDITVRARNITLDRGAYFDNSATDGPGGTIDVVARGEFAMTRNAYVSASTSGLGDAGAVLIAADAIRLDHAAITSSTEGGGDGGLIGLAAAQVSLARSTIATRAEPGSTGAAGAIGIEAGRAIRLADASEISASNLGLATDPASAGAIYLAAPFIELAGGSQVATNSTNGPAGAIDLSTPADGLVWLRGGREGPSVITTSSGPGTGGIITIAEPLAIVSQGGSILALGAAGGANVVIRAKYYIDAADTLDLILVDGNFTFDGQLDYTASGEEPRDIDPVDAGAVLSGRCRAAHARGGTSQLGIAPLGPYGLLSLPSAEQISQADDAVLRRAIKDVSRPCG